MGDRFKNFVDGSWVDSANGATFDDINPANKTDLLGSFPRSDHRDVDRAMEAARTGFPGWSRCPSIRRGEILYAAAQIIEERRDDLSAVVVRETGKLLAEANAEVLEGVAALRAIAGDGARLAAEASPRDRAGLVTLASRAPLGVVGVIAHWAFPLAGCLWASAAALAAGNTVVLKPPEDAPLAAARLVEIFLECGLPPASISLVHGHGEEAGAPLVRHPDVALVSFAGSPEVGREVGIACAAEEKRLCLDLGPRIVAIVLEDADLDLAAESVVGTGFAMAGQRWRGAARVFVQRKIAKDLTERLAERTQALRLGDGMSEATDIGPIINETQMKRVHGHTRIGLRDGAKLICGGEPVREGECKRGCFYAPTVFGDANLKMRLLQEEILGPMLALIPVASQEEAVQQANALRRDATAAVYSRDMARGFRAVATLRARRVYVNPMSLGRGVPTPLAGFRPPGSVRRRGGSDNLVDFEEWREAVIDSIGECS